MDEINSVEKLEGADLNLAKIILAFEATKISHGEEEALNSYTSSASTFGKKIIPQALLPSSSISTPYQYHPSYKPLITFATSS